MYTLKYEINAQKHFSSFYPCLLSGITVFIYWDNIVQFLTVFEFGEEGYLAVICL